MAKYIIAHDVGTSGNKAVLVDTEGHVHGKCSESYRVYYSKPDWAEQEPEDWWNAVTRTTKLLLEKTGVSPADVLCVTHCTQMLGIVPMDPKTGPLRPGIIWLDNRACNQANRNQFMSTFYSDMYILARSLSQLTVDIPGCSEA